MNFNFIPYNLFVGHNTKYLCVIYASLYSIVSQPDHQFKMLKELLSRKHFHTKKKRSETNDAMNSIRTGAQQEISVAHEMKDNQVFF